MRNEAQRAKSCGKQRESARQRCLGDIHQLSRSREGKVRLDRVALGMENDERVVVAKTGDIPANRGSPVAILARSVQE